LFSPGIIVILRRTVGGAGGFEERRRGQHFKLALPLQLKNETGMTRDISTSGIFFETERAHSIGDTIRHLLNFEHETLQCEARMVRLEPRNGQFAVAVELTSYVFVEKERVLNADGFRTIFRFGQVGRGQSRPAIIVFFTAER